MPPNLNLAPVPIIGQRVNEAAVKLVEDLLAKLRAGEAVNVAIVSERSTGEMMIASTPGGEPMKLLGGVTILERQIQDMMIAARQRVGG